MLKPFVLEFSGAFESAPKMDDFAAAYSEGNVTPKTFDVTYTYGKALLRWGNLNEAVTSKRWRAEELDLDVEKLCVAWSVREETVVTARHHHPPPSPRSASTATYAK